MANGVLPCQVVAHAGLPASTQVRFASTQVEVPKEQRLYGQHILDVRPLHMHQCDPDALSDSGIAGFLAAIARVLPEGHAVLIPRTASLLQSLRSSGHLSSMSGIEVPGASVVHVVAKAGNHWFLLSFDLQARQMVH